MRENCNQIFKMLIGIIYIMPNSLTKTEESQIKKLVYKIENDPDTLALVRFGSSVHSLVYRDIDLAIISKKSITLKKQYKYRVFLPEKYDVHFFHNLPLYIRADLLKNAVYEYVKDYNTVFDICLKTIKDFDLFEPRYNMFLELIQYD